MRYFRFLDDTEEIIPQSVGDCNIYERRWGTYESLIKFWEQSLEMLYDIDSVKEDVIFLHPRLHPDTSTIIKDAIDSKIKLYQGGCGDDKVVILDYPSETTRDRIDTLRLLDRYSWVKDLDRMLEDYVDPNDEGFYFPATDQTLSIHMTNSVLVKETVILEPNIFLDGTNGRIFIDEHCVIKSGAVIRGPCYIGPHCKIGGEVSNCYFDSYSNKAHYGFIGHSWIGRWVNWGAGSGVANLRIDYQRFAEQEQFRGATVGDSCRISCNTILRPDTCYMFGNWVIGYNFPPRILSPFRIVFEKHNYHEEELYWDKIESAEDEIRARRNKKFDPENYLKLYYKSS